MKQTYENLSKIFYAFSLWIDETRLHDTQLYVPALPQSYECDLLSKIFNKQHNLWYEYVDIKLINDYYIKQITKKSLNKQKQINYMNEIKEKKRSTAALVTQTTPQMNYTCKFIDNAQKPMLELALVKFDCALKDKFGTNITHKKLKSLTSEQIELIKKLCDNNLSNIYKYNIEYIHKNLDLMRTLDEKYLKQLLTKLWHNEIVEKYVQVPCKSLINPLHTCMRPGIDQIRV